jgi:multiple sugar transport system ATP-binding protein
MNLIEADVADGRVSFADTSFELPQGSPAAGYRGHLIVGIRPTDFHHASSADPRLPRMRVVPDVVEDLGAEHHVIFTVNAPRVAVDAVRAAVEADDEDEGKLFADDRAVFTASVDDRERIPTGKPVELAVDHSRLHFFEPLTGRSLAAL